MEVDYKILTAIIAVLTSVATLALSLIFKPMIDKKSHESKVKIEHEYEQKKKIKETLSKYKIHLINAGESLRGRLGNLLHVHERKIHYANGNYLDDSPSYFLSTVYRILRFYAWIRIIENRLVFLDTTIATQEDLNFLKYLKVMKRTLQRGALVSGLQNDLEKDNDIIFRDDLEEMSSWMILEDKVYSYSKFKAERKENIQKFEILCKFIDGMNPHEERRRWDRLFALHLILMAFLNAHGYDFQYTNEEDFNKRIKRQLKFGIFPNLILHFKRFKLDREKEVKKLISLLQEYSN